MLAQFWFISRRPRRSCRIWLWWILTVSFSSAPAAELTTTSTTSNQIVTLQMDSRRRQVMVPARVNGSEPLSFLLDTGYGITMVHSDLVESLKLQRAGRVTIVGIAGEEEAATYQGAVFDFGGVTYSPRRIGVLPADGRGGRRRDGILGAGFFRRFVVDVNVPAGTVRLHDPKTFQHEGGEILPLEFPRDTPVIEASVLNLNGPPARGRFEVDTGCDDAACVARAFADVHPWMDANAGQSTESKQGVGGSARIHSGRIGRLQLGRAVLTNVPASFFLDGSPAGAGLAGHIGMGALRRHRVIFDYSRRRMILDTDFAAARSSD